MCLILNSQVTIICSLLSSCEDSLLFLMFFLKVVLWGWNGCIVLVEIKVDFQSAGTPAQPAIAKTLQLAVLSCSDYRKSRQCRPTTVMVLVILPSFVQISYLIHCVNLISFCNLPLLLIQHQVLHNFRQGFFWLFFFNTLLDCLRA